MQKAQIEGKKRLLLEKIKPVVLTLKPKKRSSSTRRSQRKSFEKLIAEVKKSETSPPPKKAPVPPLKADLPSPYHRELKRVQSAYGLRIQPPIPERADRPNTEDVKLGAQSTLHPRSVRRERSQSID